MSRLVHIFAFVLVGTGGAAALEPCAVGMHVDHAGAANYPARIIDSDPYLGSFLVHYDNSDTREWVGANLLDYSCTARLVGPGDGLDFVGSWEEYAASAIDTFYGVPRLFIEADGDYVWTNGNNETIRGKWRPATGDDPRGSDTVGVGIVLVDGFGGDWTLRSHGGVDKANRPEITAYWEKGSTNMFYRVGY